MGMVLEGHSQGAMGMQLLAGVQVLWICFLECTACSLSVCCPRVKSKGFLRIQGVMELQGDILQGRQMFSGSFSPMDKGSITHLMWYLSPTGDTPAAPAPSLQSSGVLGTLTDSLARLEGTTGRDRQGTK